MRTATASATHALLGPARDAIARRRDAILATQIAITEVPAPTGDETQRGAWIAAEFERLRLTNVCIDGAGNVIGTRAGTDHGPPVVVCAHLDTVFPRDAIGAARRRGTRVFAPGIGDNGRGLAAMLALASAIDGAAVRTRRTVQFVATTGEEGHGDLRGAKHFFANNEAFAAVALDGSGDDRIVHRGVGSRRFRVTFDGPGGHSWADYGVVNPVHASAVAIAQLAALPLPAEPRTTLTVSRAGGGLSVNSIPQSAWFEVDIRSMSDAIVAQLEDTLRRTVRVATTDANSMRAPRTPDLAVRIDVIGSRPAGELPASAPLVGLAQAATHLVGRVPELAHASTDANVPLSLGTPAIAIGGGGSGGNVHTTDEWYDDADGIRGIERALTVVVAAAS